MSGGGAVPIGGQADLAEKAEQAFRKARERREEEIRSELREKIAAGIEEGEPCFCYPPEQHGPQCPRAIAARIRAGEFG